MREGYQPARPTSAARPQGARAARSRDEPATPVMAAEVARFFQDLRGALRLTPAQTAQALATRVDIIARSSGPDRGAAAVAGVAAASCAPTRALPGSIRARSCIRWSSCSRSPRRTAQPAPKRAFASPQSAADCQAGRADHGGNRSAADSARAASVRATAPPSMPGRAPGMALFTVTMGIALILLSRQTAVLEAAVSQLPPSMERYRPRRPGLRHRAPAPVRDGMRWIDVSRSAHPPERQIADHRPIGLDAARRGAGAHIRPQ